MQDPYRVLGVTPNVSDSELKTAYRKLAKKYHPDNYQDSNLSDMASEKMKEINEAYDQVVNARKNGGSVGGNSGGYSGYNGGYAGYNNTAGSTKYSDVRNFIRSNRIADAEQILDGVPMTSRDAEWHYLKGTVLLKKGWSNEAYDHFRKACDMDPNNFEYRQALKFVESRRNGAYGGYNTGYNTNNMNGGGCSTCNICSGLICADCCCECFGGDCISCC